MLIVFANQKGGVGKSTLALLFTDYLGELNKRCRILDCDNQQSIYKKYIADLVCENIPFDQNRALMSDYEIPFNPNSLFHIQRLPFEMLSAGMQQALDNGDTCLSDDEHDVNVFDMPGQLDLVQMKPIFQMADAIITPNQFTDFDMDSTVDFINAIDAINVRAAKFIVPNNISSIASYYKRPAQEKFCRDMGWQITPDIAKTINLTRDLNTMYISPAVKGVVDSAFTYIIRMLNLGE